MSEGEKPVPELPVTVIGVRTPDSGAPIVNGQVIQTPDSQPNLVVRVISPLVAVFVRAAKVFINTLLGGLGLTGVSAATGTLPWASWEAAAATAASAAFVSILLNATTILGDLEKRFPLLTGSV